VTKSKKWSDLGRILGYGGVPGLSTQLKNSYTRVVLPFEQFSERVKNLQSIPPATHELKTHTNIQSAKIPVAGPSTEGDDNSPPSSPLTATSSPLSEPPDESESKDMSERRSESAKPRRSPRTGSQEQTSRACGAFSFTQFFSQSLTFSSSPV
jgi:histone demethylase JARID1